MLYGSPLPITAFDNPAAVADYAAALEHAGFDFTSVAGHVMAQPAGANPQRPDRQYAGPFYDPFVTFAWLAARTQRLRFMSAILILPSWPTVLVARQAAELALFSGGRFELGVGISWNSAEYQALGQAFRDRAQRIEEQVKVLRLLWSQPYVSFQGRWHALNRVGLNRAAVPRIPIWFGTETGEKAMRRVARLADGWMPLGDPSEALPRLHSYMQEAGRDPVELQVRAPLMAGDHGALVATALRLRAAGVSHLNIVAPLELTPQQGLQRVIETRRILTEALE